MYAKSRQARIALVCIAVAFGTAIAFCRTSAAERRVTFEPQKDALAVQVDGQPLAIYVYRDPEILRPYFKDIHTPGGIQVSRRHPPREGADPVDHATMHPGLWLAFGDLGGADFWRNKTSVEHVAFVHPPLAEGNQGRFTVRNRYASEGRTICEEICTYTFHVRPAGTLILWESVFRSDESGFYFGDQEEMGLGIRVATSMMVKPYEGRDRPGRILDDLGRRNEKEIWGNRSAWCDYGGWVENRFVGMMVMPDPHNAQPCRWHARDYGFMTANPFGHAAFRQGPARKTEVKPGESFTLRFGILIHAGDSEEAVDLNAAYEDYLRALNARWQSLLKERWDPIHQAVREAMAQTPRASSLVEDFNSRLRSYLFLRRQIGHGYLDRLRFFLNDRRFPRSGRPERVGKSCAELLTGQTHPHWLEIPGCTRFHRN